MSAVDPTTAPPPRRARLVAGTQSVLLSHLCRSSNHHLWWNSAAAVNARAVANRGNAVAVASNSPTGIFSSFSSLFGDINDDFDSCC